MYIQIGRTIDVAHNQHTAETLSSLILTALPLTLCCLSLSFVLCAANSLSFDPVLPQPELCLVCCQQPFFDPV